MYLRVTFLYVIGLEKLSIFHEKADKDYIDIL